jgi:5-methylthioadenosine/S-adenosylhomocysteine deaminase
MDPTVMDAKTVIDMSTINAARALSLSNTGILKKGFDADFFILSLDKAHLQPVYNILSHLVYTAKSSDITDLFIKGKWVMQNGNITTIDETTILKKAKNWSKKILKYN